jgi:hypothetical protein
VPVLINVCAIGKEQPEAQLLNPVIVPPGGGVRIAAVHVIVEPATEETGEIFVVWPLHITGDVVNEIPRPGLKLAVLQEYEVKSCVGATAP